MYIVLTGAKKNIGDFLITDRCKKLLRKHQPDHELLQLPHWEPLDDKIDEINESDAIIIMGGPGFQPNFYPDVYKLTSELNSIKVPIIPMGVGWKGITGDAITVANYKFTRSSMLALKKISQESQYISCRDYLTKIVLKNNGIPNVLMTGCPVWYDLNSIGKDFVSPNNINSIVFTPPHIPSFKEQSVQLMKEIRNLFPNSNIYCSFHRGIGSDDLFTKKEDELLNSALLHEAEQLGFEIRDVAYNLEKISFYEKCDLHIGYRVHGHIEFLSRRKPSFLIHEDGRGVGASQSLNIKGINGYMRSQLGTWIYNLKIPWLSARLNKVIPTVKANKNMVSQLSQYIQNELENNFATFAGIGKVIDAHYEVMKNFIKTLP